MRVYLEKGTVLTATENAEAKAKNLLVTALRNDHLVVMKASFLFLQKWDEASLTPTASMASRAACVILPCGPFTFIEWIFSCPQRFYQISPPLNCITGCSAQIHGYGLCRQTCDPFPGSARRPAPRWVWAAARKSPNLLVWRFADDQWGAKKI